MILGNYEDDKNNKKIVVSNKRINYDKILRSSKLCDMNIDLNQFELKDNLSKDLFRLDTINENDLDTFNELKKYKIKNRKQMQTTSIKETLPKSSMFNSEKEELLLIKNSLTYFEQVNDNQEKINLNNKEEEV